MLSAFTPLLGAILATTGLLMAASLLKATSFFFNLLVPLPIAFLTMRQGGKPGFIALAVVAAIFAAISPADGMLIYLLQFSIASLFLPLLLRQGQRWDKAMAISWCLMIMTVTLVMWFEATAKGTTLNTLVGQYIADEVGQLKELYSQSAELSPDQKEQLLSVLDDLKETMSAVWPAIMALVTGFLLLVQVFILSQLKTIKDLISGPVFINWKAPDYLVWPMILAGFGAYFATATLQQVAFNLLIILFPLYYLQGLAIITYYFQQRGTPPWLRAISYLLLALFNPLPFFLAGVGLFDLWANFRKERVKQNSD